MKKMWWSVDPTQQILQCCQISHKLFKLASHLQIVQHFVIDGNFGSFGRQTQSLFRFIDYIKIMNQPKLKIKKYVPLVISGCSGVGKGTLITNLLTYIPELFELSISYTTRKPRPTEKHGREYFFVTKQQFQKLIKEDGFFEYCQVHGQYYGTNALQVQNIINQGKICLLDVDIQGAEKIYVKHSNWNFIFITPPSLQEIENRIRGRGMNTEGQIKRRVANAGKQLKRLSQVGFYKEIMNDKMENCYSKFISFINSRYHLLIQIQK